MVYVFHDGRVPEDMIKCLSDKGFFPLSLMQSRCLSLPVGGHVDLQMIRVGDALFVSKEVGDMFPFIKTWSGVMLSESSPAPSYPDEARFCGKVMGTYLFANRNILAPDVRDYATSHGYSLVHTKQGYVACGVLALGEKYAISADRGLARAMRACGIRVLEIQAGGVTLSPYAYGFIGGASGVFGNTVYFLGDIHTHPNGEVICDFIKEAGYSIVSLGEGELFDGGGLLFWECPALVRVGENTEDDGE